MEVVLKEFTLAIGEGGGGGDGGRALASLCSGSGRSVCYFWIVLGK